MMQLFETALVRLSETALKTQDKRSLTYWKMNNNEGENRLKYIENQHVEGNNGFKSIIHYKKD